MEAFSSNTTEQLIRERQAINTELARRASLLRRELAIIEEVIGVCCSQDCDDVLRSDKDISKILVLIGEELPDAFLSWTYKFSGDRLMELTLRIDADYLVLPIRETCEVGAEDQLNTHKYTMLTSVFSRILSSGIDTLRSFSNPSLDKALVSDYEDDSADCVDTDEFGIAVFHYENKRPCSG